MCMDARKIKLNLALFKFSAMIGILEKKTRTYFCRIFRRRTAFSAFIPKINRDREIRIADFVTDSCSSAPVK